MHAPGSHVNVLGSSARSADSVRGCPRDRPSGCRRSRTYGGQRRRDECHPGAFTQVRAVCGGEGERSVNRRLSPRWFEPDPCHQFPQVRAGEAGLRHRLWRGKGAVHQTVGCVPCLSVGQIRPSASIGRARSRCLLSCGNADKSGCPLDVHRVCRTGLASGMRGAGDRFGYR